MHWVEIAGAVRSPPPLFGLGPFTRFVEIRWSSLRGIGSIMQSRRTHESWKRSTGWSKFFLYFFSSSLFYPKTSICSPYFGILATPLHGGDHEAPLFVRRWNRDLDENGCRGWRKQKQKDLQSNAWSWVNEMKRFPRYPFKMERSLKEEAPTNVSRNKPASPLHLSLAWSHHTWPW